MIVTSKITINPHSAEVVETERGGGKLPSNVACFFIKAPELPTGLRIDPFVSCMREGGLFRIVVVNETSKPITLPKFQLLGTVELTQQFVENIAKVSEYQSKIPQIAIEQIEESLPNLRDDFKSQFKEFLTENISLFAFSTEDLGSTGVIEVLRDFSFITL